MTSDIVHEAKAAFDQALEDHQEQAALDARYVVLRLLREKFIENVDVIDLPHRLDEVRVLLDATDDSGQTLRFRVTTSLPPQVELMSWTNASGPPTEIMMGKGTVVGSLAELGAALNDVERSISQSCYLVP